MNSIRLYQKEMSQQVEILFTELKMFMTILVRIKKYLIIVIFW